RLRRRAARARRLRLRRSAVRRRVHGLFARRLHVGRPGAHGRLLEHASRTGGARQPGNAPHPTALPGTGLPPSVHRRPASNRLHRRPPRGAGSRRDTEPGLGATRYLTSCRKASHPLSYSARRLRLPSSRSAFAITTSVLPSWNATATPRPATPEMVASIS